MMQSSKGNCITDEVTEMPRCCSKAIQSEVAWRVALRPFTVPAIWMAPPNNSSFSVSVVLPASGWEMMAKVRLLLISQSLTSLNFASYMKFVHVIAKKNIPPALQRRPIAVPWANLELIHRRHRATIHDPNIAGNGVFRAWRLASRLA